MTPACRLLLALSPWLTLFACSESPASDTRPDGDGGRPTLPSKDASAEVVVAECDQAADGTPCGDSEGMHCVFGVCSANQCGDGVIAGGEQCDDGNDRDGDGCPSDCQEPGLCRDGKVDPGEECDDGNRTNDDGCSNSCLANTCGNRRLDFGEECDDGNTRDGDGCDATCGLVACGNGRLELGEACDGTAGCPAQQKCDDTCSACEGDPCGDCAIANCSSYFDVNLYAGCYVTPDPLLVERPMDGFIEKCVALDKCLLRNPTCYTTDTSHECYCGEGISIDECRVLSAGRGPCAEFYPAATACEAAEKVPECIEDFSTDLGRPVAWVLFLSQCRYENCKAECGYR
jgi:cysteine-rich repeat protein